MAIVLKNNRSWGNGKSGFSIGGGANVQMDDNDSRKNGEHGFNISADADFNGSGNEAGENGLDGFHVESALSEEDRGIINELNADEREKLSLVINQMIAQPDDNKALSKIAHISVKASNIVERFTALGANMTTILMAILACLKSTGHA